MFVEAMLLDAPLHRVPTLGEKRFGELAADADIQVLSSLHLLAAEGVAAQMETTQDRRLPAPPDEPATPETRIDPGAHDLRFRVTPHLIAPDRVRLELALDLEGQPAPHVHSVKTTLLIAPQQTAILGTELVAREERRVVLLVKVEVLRTEDDWRRALDRRVRDAASARPPTD